jgi:2-keto-4-pentenoate hydratase/2-oxohepta-3-ene-1,7-dioic acid hydratase in catechol pathway
MKLVSFGPIGNEKPGVIHGDQVIDLRGVDPSLPPTIRRIIEAEKIPRIVDILNNTSTLDAKHLHPVSGIRLGPPVTNPSKIVCLGLNYKDHAAEQKREVPEQPLLFAKAPSCLIGLGDPIPIPDGVEKMDHEVELAFVIGKRAKNISIEDAPRYVAGYAVFMDISARDVQFREKQWFRGKSFDGFGPFGPYLTTADEVSDAHNLKISMDVNGKTMQESNTGQMTFKVFFLVHYLSHSMTLEAGDVIATGTPAGVGVFASPQRFLQKNDTLTATIEGLGTLTNSVI